MKLFLGVCLALAVAASAVEIGTPEPDSPVFGYHTRFGIAEAARIKKLEEASVEDAVFNGQRMVGGSVTDISATPYQAGLVIQIMIIFQSVCGGSIIASHRVVTAAHCIYDGLVSANLFTVVLGSNTLFSGGTRITTRDVVIHPNWNPKNIINDIAVIRINSVISNNNIQLIALPSNEVFNNFTGANAFASRYGLTSDGGNIGSSQRLRSVTLPVITNAACASVYGSWVHDSNICTSGAVGRGTCQGDSGGPLVTTSNNRRMLIGVASFSTRAGCVNSFAVAYTRVTSHVSWLQTLL